MSAAALLCVPWIDPRETLFSYCVFVHRFNRMISSAASARLILQASHATRQHDIPSNLSALTQFAPALFADPVQAMRRHTVVGYYWPFMNEARQTVTCSELPNPGGVSGLRAIGASTRKLAIAHPLKWCPTCLEEDLQGIGRPTWRTEHQLPTTFVCLVHNQPLLDAGVGGKTWRWPGEGAPTAASTVSAEVVAMAAVGSAARELSAIDFECLRNSAIDRLADLGALHSRHAVRHVRLERWFSNTAVGRWLSTAPNGLSALQPGDWIAKALWRRPTSHAVRWTVLWATLNWSGPEEARDRFMAACRGNRSLPDGRLCDDATAWPRQDAPLAFAVAVQECFSYRELSARLHATRADVIRWFEAYPALRSQWRQQWLEGRRRGKRVSRDWS